MANAIGLQPSPGCLSVLSDAGRMGRSGETGPPSVALAKEANMAAFASGRPWGRVVYVCSYRRYRNGKWEVVASHFRSWPKR